MTLPSPPPRRRRHLPPPSPRRDSRSRLSHMVRSHEERERPFDPERAPSWRGSSRDLVVNPDREASVYRLNPDAFEADIRDLVHGYYPKLRVSGNGSRSAPHMSENEVVAELMGRFKTDDTEEALAFANNVLDGHGVEALGPIDSRTGPMYLYVNFGDPYVPTIMWSRDDNKVFVAKGGWGSVWEDEGQQNAEDEAWHDYLHRDFASRVRRALDDDPDYEKEVEVWDAFSPEQERDVFDEALYQAQQDSSGSKYPEWIEESSGYALMHLDVVVDKAVDLICDGWRPGADAELTPNDSGSGSVFGRTEAQERIDGGEFAAHRDRESAVEHALNDARMAPGEEPHRFARAKPKAHPTNALEEQIVAELSEPLPLGYVSNAIFYSRPVHYLSVRERDALYKLFKGGALELVRTYQPDNYWLVSAEYHPNQQLSQGSFSDLLRSHLELQGRQIFYKEGATALFVNFVNLPEGIGSAGGGAEAQNNRMMFTITWPRVRGVYADDKAVAEGQVRVEQSVSALPREYRLRAKSGRPEVIARYLADFINRVVREVPPKYTHTR